MADTPGRITLWGVEVFVATAEEQSISAAARRLGASASAVSQQLTNLETALGAALLNRRERPVALTPAGELFLRRAHSILNEAEQARDEVARAGRANLTLLRLGMIEDFDAGVTPLLLRQLASELTDARFLLETGASHRLLDKLDNRALDVAVTARMGAGADWMEEYPLLEEPFVVAAPRGAVPPEGGRARLLGMPFIRYTSRHHMGRILQAHLARQHLKPAQRFELDSYHAIMAMVAAGEGWTILTPLGVTHARRFLDQVDVLPMPFEPLSRIITLTVRRGTLGDIPGIIAARLRNLLHEQIITPCHRQMPWLKDDLRLI
jgi:DNA-binding transcriptional LysR family regulator